MRKLHQSTFRFWRKLRFGEATCRHRPRPLRFVELTCRFRFRPSDRHRPRLLRFFEATSDLGSDRPTLKTFYYGLLFEHESWWYQLSGWAGWALNRPIGNPPVTLYPQCTHPQCIWTSTATTDRGSKSPNFKAEVVGCSFLSALWPQRVCMSNAMFCNVWIGICLAIQVFACRQRRGDERMGMGGRAW